MGIDITNFLHDTLGENGISYQPPHDLITPDDLIIPGGIVDVDERNIPRYQKRFVPYEKDISNYTFPDDISIEEMKKIMREVQSHDRIRNICSEKTRMLLSISKIGSNQSEETKKKISAAMTGIPHTKKRRENIRKALVGKPRQPRSEETKKKIAEGMKKYHREKKNRKL